MEKLADLIARLEAAEVGSPDLDREVFLAYSDKPVVTYEGRHFYVHRVVGVGKHWPITKYTTSLDAALALAGRALPGWLYGVGSADDGAMHAASLWMKFHPEGEWVKAKTPALALCIATMKALSADK